MKHNLSIEYKINQSISSAEFIDLLKRSTLDKRRPIDNIDCIQGMLNHCDLLITAWHENKLVGIARAVTDFHYCCYLSDLAIDQGYQKMGIGKALQVLTKKQLQPECNLLLLAAPAAKDYYGKIGYSKNERCWMLASGQQII